MPRQIPLDLPHEPSLSRDDLIVTEANRLAVEAVDSWPAWSHPVLLVVGPPGSGKTHLAEAFAAMSGAVPFGEGMALEAGFVATIDDLDRAAHDEAAVFGVVNAARSGNGFVLATARVPAAEMPLSLPDLRSRLQAAFTVRLGVPDDALLVGVLTKLFADRQLDVEPAVMHYLATRMERSLDSARRLVARIDLEALAQRERITRRLVRRILDEDLADGAS